LEECLPTSSILQAEGFDPWGDDRGNFLALHSYSDAVVAEVERPLIEGSNPAHPLWETMLFSMSSISFKRIERKESMSMVKCVYGNPAPKAIF